MWESEDTGSFIECFAVVPVPVSIPSAFDSGVTGLAVVEIIMAGVIDGLGGRSRDRITTLESLRKPFNPGS